MAAESLLPPGYAALLSQLKQRVRVAQVKAALSANRDLIALYWDIGQVILRAQSQQDWGAKVVTRLAADLRREFPQMSGFSRANLLFMRAFAQAWSGSPIVLQPVRPLPAANRSHPIPGSSAVMVPQAARESPVAPPEPMASLPWGHNLVLLHKLESPAERVWYAIKAIQHGWSRAVLTHQIETQLHRREGQSITNFAATLPAPQSDLTQQTLKDPYLFDFLTIAVGARERMTRARLATRAQQPPWK